MAYVLEGSSEASAADMDGYSVLNIQCFNPALRHLFKVHIKLVAKNMSYQGHCRLKKALRILYMCHGFVSTQRDSLLDS